MIGRSEDVTGGQGGNAFLVLGREKTALLDCGMAYCAAQLIYKVKQALTDRNLDYIIISHSHYDHIGAIPYLRREWPGVQVLGADYAKRILGKGSALKTIRSLGEQAAKLYADRSLPEYDESLLRVDGVVTDGDIINLGDMPLRVIETKGHTKCSLSFLINNQTLFASESTGYMSKAGNFYPAFITSYADAIRSIKTCQAFEPRFIISPHYGLVTGEAAANYWQKCLVAAREARDFVLALAGQGYDEERILAKYEAVFRDEHSRREQPTNAFRLNNHSMIKALLKENYLLPPAGQLSIKLAEAT